MESPLSTKNYVLHKIAVKTDITSVLKEYMVCLGQTETEMYTISILPSSSLKETRFLSGEQYV